MKFNILRNHYRNLDFYVIIIDNMRFICSRQLKFQIFIE